MSWFVVAATIRMLMEQPEKQLMLVGLPPAIGLFMPQPPFQPDADVVAN